MTLSLVALNTPVGPALGRPRSPRPATNPAPASLPDDEVLIERLLAGDEGAFGALIEAYSGAMLRLARAFVASQAVAEEVLQETWVAVLRGLPRFERRSSLRTWLFRILSNRAKTRGVREGRAIPFTALGDEGAAHEHGRYEFDGRGAHATVDCELDTPERLVLLAEVRGVVEAAVAELPEKQRAVITLRDLELVSSQDACNILEIGETYQRVLLHRARTRVRGAIAAYLSGDYDADVPRRERAGD